MRSQEADEAASRLAPCSAEAADDAWELLAAALLLCEVLEAAASPAVPELLCELLTLPELCEALSALLVLCEVPEALSALLPDVL